MICSRKGKKNIAHHLYKIITFLADQYLLFKIINNDFL